MKFETDTLIEFGNYHVHEKFSVQIDCNCLTEMQNDYVTLPYRVTCKSLTEVLTASIASFTSIQFSIRIPNFPSS